MNVLQAAVAEIAQRETHEPAELRGWVMPLEETIVGPPRRGLLLLLGAIGAVLLIACANLANLTLTRTMGRMRDAAVRGALGARRWRLVRAVVVDQAVLAAIGGAHRPGARRAALGCSSRPRPSRLPRVQDVVIDARVVLFALGVSLRGGGRRRACCRRGGSDAAIWSRCCAAADARAIAADERVRSTLLTAQVALSVMLLAVERPVRLEPRALAASRYRVLRGERG